MTCPCRQYDYVDSTAETLSDAMIRKSILAIIPNSILLYNRSSKTSQSNNT